MAGYTGFYGRIRETKSGRGILRSMRQIYRTKGHGYPDIFNGKIIVRAPLDADHSDIAKFIRKEENWIRETFNEFQKDADKNV